MGDDRRGNSDPYREPQNNQAAVERRRAIARRRRIMSGAWRGSPATAPARRSPPSVSRCCPTAACCTVSSARGATDRPMCPSNRSRSWKSSRRSCLRRDSISSVTTACSRPQPTRGRKSCLRTRWPKPIPLLTPAVEHARRREASAARRRVFPGSNPALPGRATTPGPS